VLPLAAADRTIVVSRVAVADAVCYLFGTFSVILFCGQIGPKLLRVDLREEALKLERAYGIERGNARSLRFSYAGRRCPSKMCRRAGMTPYPPTARDAAEIVVRTECQLIHVVSPEATIRLPQALALPPCAHFGRTAGRRSLSKADGSSAGLFGRHGCGNVLSQASSCRNRIAATLLAPNQAIAYRLQGTFRTPRYRFDEPPSP
jgi:hypothetical protein